MLTRIIRAGTEDGSFEPGDPDEAALALASLIDGLAVQVTLGDATLTPGVHAGDLHRHRRAAAGADLERPVAEVRG